MQMRTPINK